MQLYCSVVILELTTQLLIQVSYIFYHIIGFYVMYINFQIVHLWHNEMFHCGPSSLFHCAPSLIIILCLTSSIEMMMLHHQHLILSFCI
jgi:hypothetical protein